MPYIDGFVLPVPTGNKDKFVNHARLGDSAFMDHGAERILECWQDDVPKGKVTDFFGAVDAREDEAVVFSWIEWPDKETRDRMYGSMEEISKTDDRFNPDKNPMPFDGKRMIWGGFVPIVEEGEGTRDSYVQGFIVPVRADKREEYRKMAAEVWEMFREYGALRVVEAWDDDVQEGQWTDFRRAVKAEPDEKVVFSYMEWPSREVCQAAGEKMMNDERMKQPEGEMPFDHQRMVYGGFQPVVRLGE